MNHSNIGNKLSEIFWNNIYNVVHNTNKSSYNIRSENVSMGGGAKVLKQE